MSDSTDKRDESESTEETDPKEHNESESETIANLKQELKKCLESKKSIENEYFKCEQELKNKTELVEKIKLEVKDLRQIVQLRNALKENNIEFMDVEEDNSQDLLRMKGKGFNRKCPQADAVPRKNISVHNTTDWNCKECDFKGASAAHLRKHVTFRHSQNLKNNQTEQEFNCQDCDFPT